MTKGANELNKIKMDRSPIINFAKVDI